MAAQEPGRRDWVVKIEQRASADSTGSSGFPVDTWTTLVAEMPAVKADAAGAERWRAEQLSSPYDTRWEIAYRLDMDPELVEVPRLRRLVHRSKVYDITSARMIGRREAIELLTIAR